MTLEDRYYRIIDFESHDNNGTFHVALIDDCDIYQGHFPDKPVCPGVCNIDTIIECASKLAGCALRTVSIKQCRMLSVATPYDTPQLTVTVALSKNNDGKYDIVAGISHDDTAIMTFKGILEKKSSI